MDLIMTLELIPQLEPIPTWNRLHQWLFWPVESLWNRLQKNWNRNISTCHELRSIWVVVQMFIPFDVMRNDVARACRTRTLKVVYVDPELTKKLPCMYLLFEHRRLSTALL